MFSHTDADLFDAGNVCGHNSIVTDTDLCVSQLASCSFIRASGYVTVF